MGCFFLGVVVVWGALFLLCPSEATTTISTVPRVSPTTCGEKGDVRFSKRILSPHFLLPVEIAFLLDLAERGMSSVTDMHGPTIMDPDLGLVLGPGGRVKKIPIAFTELELDHYAVLMARLQQYLIQLHELSFLHHTAPTFFARLLPSSSNKHSEKHVHDEYWHEHVDKNNTSHYDYSALVYLSTHEKDFTGGVFSFTDPVNNDTVVFPQAGTLLTFSSGIENPHKVSQIVSGKRIAWSTWWTCDAKHKIQNSKLLRLHEEDHSPRDDL